MVIPPEQFQEMLNKNKQQEAEALTEEQQKAQEERETLMREPVSKGEFWKFINGPYVSVQESVQAS